MIRFKDFLSEAFNIPISSKEDLRHSEVTPLFNFLKKISDEDIVMVSNGSTYKIKRAYTSEHKKISQFIKDHEIPKINNELFGDGSIGTGGVKISENTQELMVASLALLNRKISTKISEEEAISLIDESKLMFNKIIGSSKKTSLLDQFDGNFKDLATAISSSNLILDDIEGKVEKVFWTGQGWDKEIKKYNPPINNTKDYNTSDMVVKSNGKYYGYSLKKKGSSKESDPTLLNKPITGKKSFLTNIIGDEDFKKIEQAKQNFFDFLLKKEFPSEDVKKLSIKEKKTLIKKLPNAVINKYLKSKDNKFFEVADTIINKNSRSFVENFMKFIFRIDLKELESMKEFKFSLLTGIGTFSKSKGMIVSDGEIKDLDSIIEVLSTIFEGKKYYLGKSKDAKGNFKKQGYEQNSTAAKLFYTIYNNDNPIVNIEIRYKGSFTAEPQFQAMATPIFKNLFK